MADGGRQMRTGNIFEDILIIITDCEEIQKSNESQFTKEQAKISAYNDIIELLSDILRDDE